MLTLVAGVTCAPFSQCVRRSLAHAPLKIRPLSLEPPNPFVRWGAAPLLFLVQRPLGPRHSLYCSTKLELSVFEFSWLSFFCGSRLANTRDLPVASPCVPLCFLPSGGPSVASLPLQETSLSEQGELRGGEQTPGCQVLPVSSRTVAGYRRRMFLTPSPWFPLHLFLTLDVLKVFLIRYLLLCSYVFSNS